MTDRLYYDDAYAREFEATVLETQPRGAQTAVWLDRTAFYPTSGGQPFDVGTLDASPVISVEDDERGGVVHLLQNGAPAAGTIVRGRIDWERRFDHMQQHTAQHVLSAVIERTYGARTLSFHLGTESSTVDLDRELSTERITQSERAANRVVWDDVAVAVRYASEDEARALPLRKESVRTGTLRLVDIEGVDLSACGGTHVARTGALGQIAITSWERFKGGQRVEFLSGGRALRRFQQMRDTTAAAIRLLSVLPSELPAGIERMQAELKEQKRLLASNQLVLAGYEAVSLVQAAATTTNARHVVRVVDGDANRLKALAVAIAAHPGLFTVLVSQSSPALAVAARASDVGISCHDIVAAIAKEFGGRGGGKPDLAQCGGLLGTPDQVLAFVRARLA